MRVTELERQKRVMSMMITAHSVLRDRYLRLSNLFENVLLIASVLLNALVFIDPVFIEKMFDLNEYTQKLITGISSILVFAISVTLLQVKWKEKAADYSKASTLLSELLYECRAIMLLPDGINKDAAILEFDKKYSQVNNIITKIPESKFNSLKLIHYRKKELSKLITSNPGSRLFILKIKLLLSSFAKKS